MVGFLSFMVCLALSAGIGYAAWLRLRTHNRRSALRMAAVALVPLGLDLAGFVRLGRKVSDAVGHWALNLVFNPLTWLGIVMLGLAALLWIVTGFGTADEDVAGTAAPARRAVGPSRQKPAPPVSEDAEVEAILRRHGVS